jgi:hypothetical protein
VLENPFINVPQNGSEYIIAPGVSIIGDGTETEEAVAIANINASAGNIVSSVTMLDIGANYKIANCYVNYSNAVPVVTNASVRAIQSPPGGHGSNVANELGCNTVCLSVTFANSEGNTIPTSGVYGQLGLLENPLFTSCTLGINNQVGFFITGERIQTYSYIKLTSLGQVNSVSNVVTASDGDFLNQLEIG